MTSRALLKERVLQMHDGNAEAVLEEGLRAKTNVELAKVIQKFSSISNLSYNSWYETVRLLLKYKDHLSGPVWFGIDRVKNRYNFNVAVSWESRF
jgi:hypothetical protein